MAAILIKDLLLRAHCLAVRPLATWRTRLGLRTSLSARATPTNKLWRIASQRFVFTWRPLAPRSLNPTLRSWRHSSRKPMPKFPVDAPKRRVVRALQLLGFQIVTRVRPSNGPSGQRGGLELFAMV